MRLATGQIYCAEDDPAIVAFDLQTGVPSYQVEDGQPRRRLGGGGRKAEFIY